MRAAIIDLGTNTFNLIIAENKGDTNYKLLYNKKIPVKLGEGRINESEIIPAAYKRGIEAIKKHFTKIKEYEVDTVKAFGTSALRTAANGPDFLKELHDITNIEVSTISGDREAELISKGVVQTINFGESPFLILDIGGGSNEFIITTKNKVLWKKSYPLGIARLLARFKPSDPITGQELEVIKEYILTELDGLFPIIRKYKIENLVGASGSFETFNAMINRLDGETEVSLEPIATKLETDKFKELFEKLIHSTYQEREQMPGLEKMRIEMIVLAIYFVKVVLDNSNISSIFQSNFALKEGALIELFNN